MVDDLSVGEVLVEVILEVLKHVHVLLDELVSSATLDLTSAWRCWTVALVTSASSFSGTHQAASIILTKYSSLGMLMERSL